MAKPSRGDTSRQPTPPSEDATATEPATLDTCRADYAAGRADRESMDRHVRRYHGEWSK